MQDEPLPAIPSWRLQGADDALREAIEMNNTLAIDMGILVVDYLQSWEFFAVIIIFLVYRAVNYFVSCLPRLMQQYNEAKRRR